MLAPPASRAGVSKGGARSRLAEKQQANAAAVNQQPIPLGATKLPHHLTTVASTPLHLRMVSDVEFVVYPFSLMFYDPACEIDYLKCAGERVPRHIMRVTGALLILFSIALGFEATRLHATVVGSGESGTSAAFAAAHQSLQSVFIVRVILISLSLILACVFGLTSKIEIPYRPNPQIMITILLTVCGSLWAIATVYGNDTIYAGSLVLGEGRSIRPTECASVILFVLILHAGGRYLFFHLSCFPSGITTIVYLITSTYFSSSHLDSSLHLTWHCLLSLGSCLLCWLISYRFEILKRSNHISELKVELGRREKADLKKEAFDLRDEMYVMTLERYDIADIGSDKKELEFKSPMEQAMGALQDLSDNKSLPKDAFLMIQKVIGLLGNSSDVFKVQVADQLADKNIRLDDETTRYLFDLVNSNDQHTYEESGGGSGGDGGGSGVSIVVPPGGSGTPPGVGTPTRQLHGGAGLGLGSSDHAPSHNGTDSGPQTERERDDGTTNNNPANVSFALERSQTRHGGGLGGGGLGGMIGGVNSTGNGSLIHVPSGVLAKEEKQINELLKNMDTWNFDVFEVANLTGGKPLFFVGTALFKKYNLINKFHIDRAKLSNFLNVIEAGYLKTNPYHNSVHASDVARTAHYFLHTRMRSYTTDLEIFGLIIASLVHDYDHPGRTNQYHVVTRDPKAILYNDKAVLEMHHCSAAFFLLHKDENNILSSLSSKDYTQIRKIIIELVLATDLGAHFDFLAQFKSSVSSGSLDSSSDKLVGPNAYANRLMIHKMALKASDLGHSAKTLVLHEKWTHRITEEFYRQGDEERKRNLPISPFMDRQKANLPQSQVGFLDFLVIPMFNIWVKFLELDEQQCPLMDQLKRNKEHWKAQLEAPTQTQAAVLPLTITAPTLTTTTTTMGGDKVFLPPPTIATFTTPIAVAAVPTQPNTNVQEERQENPGDGSNKVAPAP